MSRSNTPKNKPGSAGGTRGKPGTPGSRRGTPKGGKRSGKLSQEEEERLREARVTEELRRLKVIEDKKRMGKTLLVQKWKALIVPTLYFWKYKGDNDLLKLLNDPIAKDAWDPHGSFQAKTPLRHAVVYRDIKLIDHLIEVFKVDIMHVSVDDGDGWGGFIEAAAQGWTDGVDYFLKKKHPVDKPADIGGRNALLHAAKNGYYATCKFLLENGAFPDTVDNNRYNALMHAVKRDTRYNAKVMAKAKEMRDLWFKSNSQAIKAKPKKGQGGRQAGKGKGKTISDAGEKVAETKTKGPDMFGKSDVVPEHNRIVKLLIKRRSNIDHRDRWGRTVLSHAAEAGNRQACAMLILAGARINEADKENRSPIHWALAAGQFRIVRLLVRKGCDINVQDQDDFTPLMMAVKLNRPVTALFLVGYDANINIKTGHGHTALTIALHYEREEIIRYLKTFAPEAKMNYKNYRRELRMEKRERERAADELLIFQQEEAERLEKERLEKEAKKKKKKGGKKKAPRAKTPPLLPVVKEHKKRKERKLRTESDISSEPETSDFDNSD